MDLPVDYTKMDSSERRVVREEYVRLQENRCMFCQGSLSNPPPKSILMLEVNWSLFPNGFLKYPIHLQHSHSSGLTEGAVHAYCNAVMWQYYGR